MLGQGEVGLARGQRAHIHPFVVDGIHAYAVPEEGAAGFALRGVDADQADALPRERGEEATNQFVDHGGLARATCSGDAQNGHLGDVTVGGSEGLLKPIWIELSGCDATRNGSRRSTGQGAKFLA